MTRLIAFAFAVLSALSAAAVASPIGSDYFWVGGYVTNKIAGVVMGDSGEYSAMRYEDRLFIEEADLERYLIAIGFTSENKYRINRNSVLYNVYPEISAIDPLCDDYYLDPSVELSEDVTICTGTVYHVSSASNRTTIVTNIVRVSQTMTNGTTDVHESIYSFTSNIVWIVHTNATLYSLISNMSWTVGPNPVVVTNASRIDTENFVTKGNPWTVYDARTSQIDWSYYGVIGWKFRPYSLLFMTNTYATIRACRRTKPYVIPAAAYKETDISWNKKRQRDYYLYDDDRGTPQLTSDTNSFGNISYSTYCKTYWDQEIGTTVTNTQSGGWTSVPYSNLNAYKWFQQTDPEISSFKITTKIPTRLELDAGRGVVRELHPYLTFKLQYHMVTRIGYSTTTNASNYATETSETNEHFYASIPLGSSQKLYEGTEFVTYVTRFENLGNKIRDATTLYGWSVMTPGTQPTPLIEKRLGDAIRSTHDASRIVTWKRKTKQENEMYVYIREPKIVYVLDLNPRTTLSTWTEY